jgi:hypothetical protein
LSPAHKKQIQNNKAGPVLRRPFGGLDFWGFGDVGVPFFWFLFLGKQEKELAAGQPPANGQPRCEGLTTSVLRDGSNWIASLRSQ